MNAHTNPWDSLAEQMLAAVAIKIELPPSGYITLIERCQAIEKHLKRSNSPLREAIGPFYLQGSVAIGATIRSRRRSDGFDADMVVELKGRNWNPRTALDMLFDAVRGAPGCIYHDITERQTRCVTIGYKSKDNIHVDLTPAELVNRSDPRRSDIFHAKPEEHPRNDRRVPMNSYAFVNEYNRTCSADTEFKREYSRRAIKADLALRELQRGASSLPQLPHSSVQGGKSAVTVALQLIKRYLNNRWENRTGRRPASVMLSCLALETAQPGRSICVNLEIIAAHILNRLNAAHCNGQLIHVCNPRCHEDIFTDRWPENLEGQACLINDMERFLKLLRAFFDENTRLADRAQILKQLFGEDVGTEVMNEIAKEHGQRMQSGKHLIGPAGSILPTSVAAGAHSTVPPNTFYGSRRPKR